MNYDSQTQVYSLTSDSMLSFLFSGRILDPFLLSSMAVIVPQFRDCSAKTQMYRGHESTSFSLGLSFYTDCFWYILCPFHIALKSSFIFIKKYFSPVVLSFYSSFLKYPEFYVYFLMELGTAPGCKLIKQICKTLNVQKQACLIIY